MKLLKKRSFAILLTIVVAILATLLGVYKTSVRDTREIEAMFNDGVYLADAGYTQPGIATHINNCADAALGLATITEKYPELAGISGELILARRELLSATSIRDKGHAYSIMTLCYYDLYSTAALNANLSERDINAAEQYSSTYAGARSAVAASGYNGEVMRYLDGRSALVRFISAFVPIKAPDSFAFDVLP